MQVFNVLDEAPRLKLIDEIRAYFAAHDEVFGLRVFLDVSLRDSYVEFLFVARRAQGSKFFDAEIAENEGPLVLSEERLLALDQRVSDAKVAYKEHRETIHQNRLLFHEAFDEMILELTPL